MGEDLGITIYDFGFVLMSDFGISISDCFDLGIGIGCRYSSNGCYLTGYNEGGGILESRLWMNLN
jgi:hypothetical protein